MALDDILEDVGAVSFDNKYRTYEYHEYEDKLWEWFHELEERFPVEEIDCDFIEVSPRIKKNHAKAFYRDGGKTKFIRFSERYIENQSDWALKRTLLHEMVHIYTYQMGHKQVSDSSVIFKWLCGAVGAEVNSINTLSDEWNDLAEPFMDINSEQ